MRSMLAFHPVVSSNIIALPIRIINPSFLTD